MQKYVASNSKYNDIIHMPHPVSKVHPRMSDYDRAAQFSPFAALTGYETVIKETARLTSGRTELDENKKEVLDERLRRLKAVSGEAAVVTITYFVPDGRKAGGAYEECCGIVKKIDEFNKCLLMEDMTVIPIEEIVEIDGELFYKEED